MISSKIPEVKRAYVLLISESNWAGEREGGRETISQATAIRWGRKPHWIERTEEALNNKKKTALAPGTL